MTDSLLTRDKVTLGGEMVYVKGMAVEAVEKLAKKVEEPSRRRVA